MTHKHTYTQRTFTTLTLPTLDGRYELSRSFLCACGEAITCTMWSLNRGRHHTLEELQAIKARETAKPQTKGKR